MQALIYGDLFMRMLYHVRPYELVPGSANELHETWKKKLIADLTDKNQKYGTKKFKANVRQMVHEFDTFPIHEDMKKPRVGIVGEILVKFLPLANNQLVDLLEREGAEAVMPDLLDFLSYCAFDADYKAKYLGGTKRSAFMGNAGCGRAGISAQARLPGAGRKQALHSARAYPPAGRVREALRIHRQPVRRGMVPDRRDDRADPQRHEQHCLHTAVRLPAEPCCRQGCHQGTAPSAIPESNIIAVDYDPGASEVNQLNRIKLMLSTAVKNLNKEEEDKKEKTEKIG